MKKLLNLLIITFTLLLTQTSFAEIFARPPQYVLIAYDGSLNIDVWKETLAFAKKNNIKYTYFISGVYFLLDSNHMDYVEPTKGPGHSAIGFAGDSKSDLIARVNYVNQAYDAGHSIGSHVNGHFDGTDWKLPHWELEFNEFNHLLFNVFTQNGFNPPQPTNPFHFKPEQIIGFRSPLLATNPSLYETLRKNKFVYDTSQTNSMDYWPHNNNGVWNFPLAEVRIYGTGKQTLSMDYNFYFVQSGGKPDLKNAELYRKEMYDTYMAYFRTNYYGNRAPIHIGHHFSKWNGGAYSNALADFTKSVCHMPEVKCVSYQTLLQFMNSITPEQRNAYQEGNFQKLPIPEENKEEYKKDIAAVAPIDVHFVMKKISDEEIEVSIHGKHAGLFPKNADYVWKVNDKEIYRSHEPRIKISALPKMSHDSKLTAALSHRGKELLKTSHMMSPDAIEDFILLGEDLERRAGLGDMPEAHDEWKYIRH